MVSHAFGWRDTCAAWGVSAKRIGSSDWLGFYDEDTLLSKTSMVYLIAPIIERVITATTFKTCKTELQEQMPIVEGKKNKTISRFVSEPPTWRFDLHHSFLRAVCATGQNQTPPGTS